MVCTLCRVSRVRRLLLQEPLELFRPIVRDGFRGLLIDSSVGLRFVVAARALACGEFSGVL
jgi:hypothetical protein